MGKCPKARRTGCSANIGTQATLPLDAFRLTTPSSAFYEPMFQLRPRITLTRWGLKEVEGTDLATRAQHRAGRAPWPHRLRSPASWALAEWASQRPPVGRKRVSEARLRIHAPPNAAALLLATAAVASAHAL